MMINKIQAVALGVILVFSHNAFSAQNYKTIDSIISSGRDNKGTKSDDSGFYDETTLYAQSPETIYSVVSSMPDKFYVLGETTGGNSGDFEKTLNNSADKVKQILLNKNYDIKKEQNTIGHTPLHIAARYGYYTIVDALLKDKRYLPMLATKDELGFTPLDAAKIRERQTFPFIQPSIELNPLALIPFMVTQNFYSGELEPYKKTIKILESYNAESTCSLSKCYKRLLAAQLDDIKKRVDEKAHDPIWKKNNLRMMDHVKDTIEKQISMLNKNASLPEDELLTIIMKDVQKKLPGK